MGSAPVAVDIRGTIYPSISAAARVLGITHQAVWAALEQGRLDTVGTKRSWIVAGQTFTILKDIAAAAGLHPNTVRRLLREDLTRLEAAIKGNHDGRHSAISPGAVQDE